MKKSICNFLLSLCLFTGFLSCKQTKTFDDMEVNTDRVIAEFTDARTGTVVAKPFSSSVIEVDLTELQLSNRSVIQQDATVKIIANPVVVSQYNSANGTNYVVAGNQLFSLTPTYTLKADQRKVKVRALLKPSDFLNEQYAIGLSIAEVANGEISAIAKDVLVVVSIKNDYDGIYSLKAYSNIPSTPYVGNFSLPCSEELEVATAGSSAVYLSPTQPVFNAGSFAYISNLLPQFTIDKTTNKITAVNTRTGGLDLVFPYDATYNSRYDPASKTIYVKYGIAPVGSGRYIIDTLTFCRPR